ncbi:MAG: hypothetical protein M1834_007625 [Cirrosporium novae-zelandiae]|nr:MAG: hypothetical protein M1834_007625 [Cirrosporium novae-zelandiae]
MAKPKRAQLSTITLTSTPPDELGPNQSIARLVKAAGNNIYHVSLPDGKEMLVEMPARFRNTIWVKRGGYVMVDTQALGDRDNKLGGEIMNIVREEREWKKQPYWPKEFMKKPSYLLEDSDEDEDSVVGKMPPDQDSE